MGKRLRSVLSGSLASKSLALVCNSYDVVGDIAIIRLDKVFEESGAIVADAVMKTHKNLKTVLAQTGGIQGDFRLRRLEFVAGERKTATVHREWGCLFSVDLEKCYFSPRLSYERMRIARQVGDAEVVTNMFAGAGCFSILIAKHSNVEKVYSVDANPFAVRYMRENVRLNRVCGKVLAVLGDAREVVEGGLRHAADRVLMPLPEKAFEYLPCALSALKQAGGWIHYYDFEHARRRDDAVEKVASKVSERLRDLGTAIDMVSGRVVRAIGPNWYQVVLDLRVRRAQCSELSEKAPSKDS